MPKKKFERTHPVDTTCVWRFQPKDIPEEKYCEVCRECYEKLPYRVQYCDHMARMACKEVNRADSSPFMG